jgi:hypothetical protein
MTMHKLRPIFPQSAICFALLFATTFVHGQAADAARDSQFAIWSGANFTNGHIFGYTQDRRMVQVGFTWAPALLRHSLFTLRYRMDALPVAFLHDHRYAAPGAPVRPGSEWVYGAGLNPVGAQMDFHNRTRVTPFFEVTGGFLYFRRKVLAYDETRFQFTIAPGIGFRIPIANRTALLFGYNYHHMSNANIDRSNPGVDSQILSTGLTF